jgi:serine/threonine-protein kinase
VPASDPTGAADANPDPRTIAGFRLLRQVGEGGMSQVFLSYDVATDRPVAVKVLADHLATSREFVNRFYREARLSRLLAHPNLVRGLGAGYDPEARKHYLVLEYVDGPTAHSVLVKRGKFPVGAAVKAAIDIARALEFLHARKYIHRDVKPDNVLLHPCGIAKLADLGLAKRLNDDPQLTSVSQGIGTSYYMAYEQAMNADFVDGRSDIFALGATLYHLLTGEVPFPGTTHEEIMHGKKRGGFVPLAKLNPDVPPRLADIIATTLASDPGRRYQTAGELAEALESTGLATPIPVFGDVAGMDSHPSLPTRADLEPLGSADALMGVSVQSTATFPALPSPERVPTASGLRRDLRKRVLVALTLVAAAAVGSVAVGALLADRPTSVDPAHSPTRLTRDLPDPNPATGSLTPAVPR